MAFEITEEMENYNIIGNISSRMLIGNIRIIPRKNFIQYKNLFWNGDSINNWQVKKFRNQFFFEKEDQIISLVLDHFYHVKRDYVIDLGSSRGIPNDLVIKLLLC